MKKAITRWLCLALCCLATTTSAQLDSLINTPGVSFSDIFLPCRVTRLPGTRQHQGGPAEISALSLCATFAPTFLPRPSRPSSGGLACIKAVELR